MQEVLRGVVRRFVVRRGANQPKTIVDAHSTAARRQMACGKRPISLRPRAVGDGHSNPVLRRVFLLRCASEHDASGGSLRQD
jgi:hypothetical protein